MSDNNTPAIDNDPDLDAPSAPRTLLLHLEPSNKRRYDDLRRSPDVVARKPFGYLHMSKGTRTVFIADQGKYYEGMFPAYYSIADFQNSDKRGTHVFIHIGLHVAA
jgi:hypothetical protein